MENLSPVDNYLHGSWEALGQGAPMLVALAQLCSEAWVLHRRSNGGAPADSPLGTVTTSELEPESLAILYAARERGIIEVRAVNSAFDAAARLLAVYVELDEERTIAFRDAKSPEVTLRFLAGFRNLCERGLILHHIFRDFSLSPHAFEIARTISKTDVQVYLDMATEFGLHD